MRLSEMQREVYEQLGFGDQGDPAQKVINRVTQDLNAAYREILGRKGFQILRRAILEFSSVANSRVAVLPMVAHKLLTVFDTTNQMNLVETTLAQLRRDNPGSISTTSTPQWYVIENLAAATAVDPSAACELFVKSTDAADGTGLTAYVEGIRTGGYARSLNIALNGTTAVSFDPTVTDIEFVPRAFRLSAPAVGDITLHEGSGSGTELARIPAGRTSAKYTRLLLHMVPAASLTYSADVELAIEGMVNPNDEPIFDEDYHFILPAMALMRAYQKREKPNLFANERRRAQDGINQLVLFCHSLQTNLAEGKWPRRFSQLGPYFPPGS